MPDEKKQHWNASAIVALGKDLVAMLRDGVLLLLAILLLVWPQAINNVLVAAGFEEGSFAGLKWKARLSGADAALVKAQTAIADLKEQNDKLSQTLAEVQSGLSDPKLKADITAVGRSNSEVAESAATAQASVASSIAANAPLVQKIEYSTGAVTTWGVVYGADRDLAAARFEIEHTAPKLGLPNASIYHRQGSYRSVSTTTDRLQADQLLNKARERRPDAYIVNMSTWCPQSTAADGYFECGGAG